MIKVDGLSKIFGSKSAVNDLSFQVEKGEVLGFIGPNGAGKSTTMRIITGFIPASSGSVYVGGFKIDEKPLAAKSLIGYLPENAPLYSNKTVFEFLHFMAELRGFSGDEAKKKVDSVIDTCFLEPVRNQNIDTLSKGYSHRTCFAQAILHDPDVLILDEPTDGLDPNQKREIRKIIKEMGKSKAIIISTHILEEVEAITSRVLLISEGQKAFDGAPDEFRQQARSTKGILLSLNGVELDQVAETLKELKEVKSTEVLDSMIRILPEEGKNKDKLRKVVYEKVSSANWDLRELKYEESRLDEVFELLTIGKEDA